MPHDRRVDDEAAELRGLEEDAIDARRVAIGAGDDRLQVVLDQPLDHAPEEGPRGLEAIEDGGQILAQSDPQKRIAAEAERDEQPVDPAAPPSQQIGPETQQAEIDLGGFACRRVGHPHGHGRRAEVTLRAASWMRRW